LSRQSAASPNRRFKFDKRRRLFIRSHDAVIRVYDDSGNVIETHEHKGDFKELRVPPCKGLLRVSLKSELPRLPSKA
jgi:hypothetical protein